MVTVTLQFVKIISNVGVRTGPGFIMFLLNTFALFNNKLRFCLNGNSLFYFYPHNNIKCYDNINVYIQNIIIIYTYKYS